MVLSDVLRKQPFFPQLKRSMGTQTTRLGFPAEARLQPHWHIDKSQETQNFLEQPRKDARDPGKSQRSYSELHFPKYPGVPYIHTHPEVIASY